jgi:putative DNA primase/helicase
MTVHIHPESTPSFSAESIAKALGNGKEQPSGKGWLTCCPAHEDSNPSLSIKDSTDHYGRPDVFLKCFAGCDYKAVQTALRAKGLLPEWRPPRAADPADRKQTGSLPAYIWKNSRHDQTAAETIQKAFAFRSIQLEQIPPNIRLNSYKEGQLSIACAMQSPLDENPPAKPQCVHLTLLDKDGKKCGTRYRGPKTGLVVMLPGKDRSSLVIGEGLETTLSAMQAMGFSGMVCGDAGNMAGMTKMQAQFQEIFILVDSDANHAGQNAARKAAENIGKANPQAAVWLVAPDDSCFTAAPEQLDFNDLLKQDTSGGSIRARFERKKRLDEIDWRPKEKEQPAKAAEPEKKKTPEVWSFADVEAILEHNPELLKWMVCAPDQELTTVQKHELAEEILLHNSFRPAELNAVRDMLKRQLGIAKSGQEQVLRAERKKEAAHNKTTSFKLIENDGKGGVRLIAQNRAAMFLAETMEGKYAVWSESMKWYEFAGTHWKECQRGEFEEEASKIFNNESGDVGYSDNYFVGSTNILRRLGHLKINDQDKGKIPFSNGILDLDSMKLEQTTHQNALKWHIPYHYKKESKCDGFLGWLDQACQDDTKGLQKMIRATINLCLQSRQDLQYFIHLKGKPGTGKGTLSRLLQKIVGSDGFAASDIELLNNDKFEAGNYFDKRLLIFDEIPSHVPIKKFLRLTGRDPMRREGKYEKAASPFIYDGVVLLLGNDYFSTDDQTSFATERRRITIVFDKVFSAIEKRVWREIGGEDALHEEIPGIINWALQMTKEEVSECFDTPPEKVVKANKEAEAVNSPIVEFIQDHVEYDVTGKVQVGANAEMRGENGEKIFKDRDTKLFPRYLHWCVATGKKPTGRTKFVETFMNAANRHLLPAPDAEQVERSKTKYNGNYPLLGIRLVPWSDTEFCTDEDDLGTLGTLGSSETERY